MVLNLWKCKNKRRNWKNLSNKKMMRKTQKYLNCLCIYLKNLVSFMMKMKIYLNLWPIIQLLDGLKIVLKKNYKI